MVIKLVENYSKYLILIIGVAFIFIGVSRQEHIEVLQKAINVCLECIGVG